MVRTTLLLLVACLSAVAVEIPETLVVDGQTYKGVVYKSHDALRLRFMHEDGVTALPISSLPVNLQGKLGYDNKIAQAKLEKETRPEEASAFPRLVSKGLGENLSECETRYGPSKALELPSDLALGGVKGYEFRRDPYTIVVLIGNEQGVFNKSYFKRGKFNEAELVDLVKPNWSVVTDELRGMGLVPDRGAGSIMSWWIGQSPYNLEVWQTAGRTHSELAIRCFSLNYNRIREEYTWRDAAVDFSVAYLKMLDAGVDSGASSAFREQNGGL
jgi:hypothetical protein